jgi:hypothetical protein
MAYGVTEGGAAGGAHAAPPLMPLSIRATVGLPVLRVRTKA